MFRKRLLQVRNEHGVFAVCYLQEEEPLGHFLDELLGHVLREELGSELELQWVLLLHILLGHLKGRNNTAGSRSGHGRVTAGSGVSLTGNKAVLLSSSFASRCQQNKCSNENQ